MSDQVHDRLWRSLLEHITDIEGRGRCRCDACTIKAWCDGLVYFYPRQVVNTLRTHLVSPESRYWH